MTEFELRHWTGKVIFGMSFRRPLMSILEAVFMEITRAEMGPSGYRRQLGMRWWLL